MITRFELQIFKDSGTYQAQFKVSDVESLLDQVDDLIRRLSDTKEERDRWLARMKKLEYRLDCIEQAVSGRMDP